MEAPRNVSSEYEPERQSLPPLRPPPQQQQQQQQQQPTGSSFLGGSSIVGHSLLGERTVDEIDGLQLTMEPEDIATELPPAPAPSLMRQTTGGGLHEDDVRGGGDGENEGAVLVIPNGEDSWDQSFSVTDAQKEAAAAIQEMADAMIINKDEKARLPLSPETPDTPPPPPPPPPAAGSITVVSAAANGDKEEEEEAADADAAAESSRVARLPTSPPATNALASAGAPTASRDFGSGTVPAGVAGPESEGRSAGGLFWR